MHTPKGRCHCQDSPRPVAVMEMTALGPTSGPAGAERPLASSLVAAARRLGPARGPTGAVVLLLGTRMPMTLRFGPCRASGGPLALSGLQRHKKLVGTRAWAVAFGCVLMATELPASSIASDEVSFPRMGCDSSRRMSAFPQDQRRFGPTTRAEARFFWRWRKPLCENRVGELCVWKRPKRQFQYRNATERVY